MQFTEGGFAKGKCPVCGKEIVIRTTRSKTPNYCSRVCASQPKFAKRYKGTMSGPMDRPTMAEKMKL